MICTIEDPDLEEREEGKQGNAWKWYVELGPCVNHILKG